jgi:hypothetical protein
MEFAPLDELEQASELLEKANSGLQPGLLSTREARAALGVYARVQRLAAYGVAALAGVVEHPSEVARTTGTSLGKAREVVETGRTLEGSGELSDALRRGEVSLEQATEIAGAERSAPGSATELLAVARDQAFSVLRDRAREVRLGAEQRTGDLAERQHAARTARSSTDELGMVHVHVELEPHVGVPVVNRAEREAARLHREAKHGDGEPEGFDRYLADAYAGLLAGSGSGPARRPELVVVVSHGVATRGWRDVQEGEVCKIPGEGPVSPRVARDIACDAFLTGVISDGRDLRHMRRWTRNIPVEVRLALELGPPPEFPGVRCVDCGNRFRTEIDHVEPHAAGGPASTDNLRPRCWACHRAKTARDRTAGKLRAPDT